MKEFLIKETVVSLINSQKLVKKEKMNETTLNRHVLGFTNPVGRQTKETGGALDSRSSNSRFGFQAMASHKLQERNSCV